MHLVQDPPKAPQTKPRSRKQRERRGAIHNGELEIVEDGARHALYTVSDGDTLEAIAGYCYGNDHFWELILEENGDQIEEAEDIEVGMVLRVPLLDED